MYNDKLSGPQIINVKASLELSKSVQIEFGDTVEISLDCAYCLARRRTISVFENAEYGICVKTKHQFPIKMKLKMIIVEENYAEVVYQIEYWYSPFFDRKYNQESSYLPTWGRITFTTVCSVCLRNKESSLQTNTVRPWTNYCECGASLYTEKNVMPIFENMGK